MTLHAQRYRATRLISGLLAATAMMVVAGCKNLDVENLNGISSDGFETAPTVSQIVAAASGLSTTWRGLAGGSNTFGYEYWSFRASEPRGLTNAVLSPITGGAWSFGTIKNINLVLSAVESAAGLTDAEKDGFRGWLKLHLALQYQDMAAAHDSFGVVLVLQADPVEGDPAPINTKTEVWNKIFSLMDESYAHFATAGSSFKFKMGTGFAGYNTPANLRMVNRALKARWQAFLAVPLGRTGYNVAEWDAVLATLAAPNTWINPSDVNSATIAGMTAAQLRAGPYHFYDASATNGLSTADRFSHSRFHIEAQCISAPAIPAAGTIPPGQNACAQDTVRSSTDGKSIAYTPTNRDGRAFGANARVQALTAAQSDCLLLAGTVPICRHLRQTDPLNPSQSSRISTTSPMPVIRNEELLLIRAEAYMNKGDCATTILDLNRVRQSLIANLPAISCPYAGDATLSQPATLEDAWLYEKRFSMWGEHNSVWYDMRHYGKANLLPHHDPSFRIFDIFPIPQAECEVRGYATKGCFPGGYAGIQGGPNLLFQPWQ